MATSEEIKRAIEVGKETRIEFDHGVAFTCEECLKSKPKYALSNILNTCIDYKMKAKKSRRKRSF